MTRFNLNNKYIDNTFWLLYMALILVAIMTLFSASSSLVYSRGSILGPIVTQTLYLIVGAGLAYGIQFTPSKLIRYVGYLIYGFSDILLWLMMMGLPGSVTRNGATRWFRIMGIEFQPSEILKLGLIIVLADLLSRIKSEEDKKRVFWITFGLTMASVVPVITQNVSTAILICLIVGMMWILAAIPWKYIGGTVAAGIVSILILFFTIKLVYIDQGHKAPGHMGVLVTRVMDMFESKAMSDEEFVLDDDNYQQSIAKVAIARGGTTPIGVGPGRSQERDFLPLAFADYIFAIFVEETGIFGAIILAFLYLMILSRACYISSRYADYAATYMVMGLALMLTSQALISMMVAVGIGPVTGQPLPLISRGGTSVLITSIYFGIIMAVSREQKLLAERSQESKARSFNDIPVIEIDE